MCTEAFLVPSHKIESKTGREVIMLGLCFGESFFGF